MAAAISDKKLSERDHPPFERIALVPQGRSAHTKRGSKYKPSRRKLTCILTGGDFDRYHQLRNYCGQPTRSASRTTTLLGGDRRAPTRGSRTSGSSSVSFCIDS
jgi:hypothetical protein